MPHCHSTKDEQLSYVASEKPLTEGVETKGAEVISLKSMEENHIRELLQRYRGNRKQVADALGISERTIYRKLKRLGI